MFNELWDAIILAGTLATGQPVVAMKPLPLPAPDQYERRILPGDDVCIRMDQPVVITSNRILGTEDADTQSYTFSNSATWCKLNDITDADIDMAAARPFISPVQYLNEYDYRY